MINSLSYFLLQNQQLLKTPKPFMMCTRFSLKYLGQFISNFKSLCPELVLRLSPLLGLEFNFEIINHSSQQSEIYELNCKVYCPRKCSGISSYCKNDDIEFCEKKQWSINLIVCLYCHRFCHETCDYLNLKLYIQMTESGSSDVSVFLMFH